MSTFTPFALELYRRHMAGDTAEKLASELTIPPDRIEQRLRAAAAYLARRNRQEEFSAARLECVPVPHADNSTASTVACWK